MKRSTRSIGVISLIVGALALVVVFGLRQESRESEPDAESISQPHPRPSTDAAQEPTGLARDITGDDRDNLQPSEPERLYSESERQADLTSLREEATKDVLVAGSLMFKHLGLTESEKSALTDFLVEVWMSSTWMRNYNPEPIEEGDRRAGIAAIIGDAKLEQLLNLESNGAEYREAGRIALLLQTNDVPLPDTQQDQILDILIQVRGRHQAFVEPNAQDATIEFVESQMATMDEYERLVLELAPSALSTRQLELLFDRYQAFSYRRAKILEMQKKSRANDTAEDDFPLVYPARN
jgi:hypothetical protein